MARGIGEQTARSGMTFWDLPETVQADAEKAAVLDARVEDWFDLEPAVRRAVRDQAVLDWLTKGSR